MIDDEDVADAVTHVLRRLTVFDDATIDQLAEAIVDDLFEVARPTMFSAETHSPAPHAPSDDFEALL